MGNDFYSITEDRLLELGEAERVLDWVRGSIRDLEHGRNAIEVFAEVVSLLQPAPAGDLNGPAPLTPGQVLLKSWPSWK